MLRKRTFFGLILFLLAEISSPALLNSLSEGTAVATEDRYTLATFANEEKIDYSCLMI